ncbi:peptidoglycan D,D-transpeptidase FtsI family protein [Anaerobacillus arseniciselenatis]|nr:penicillin-binding transpeptidase domain-containing protein [Anaerobacillus arseniciselenatis]
MLIQKRTIQVLVIFMLILSVLIIRLAYVQLFATHHYSKNDIDLVAESIKQRTQSFVLHSGRGYFSDRRGEPLDVDYYPSLILFPFLKDQKWPVHEVANILDVNEDALLKEVSNAKEPIVFHMNGERRKLKEDEMTKINQLKIPGVYAQYVQERTENIAPHLIGVTGENVEEVKRRYSDQLANGNISIHAEVGVSGMQRSFDPFLISQGDAKLVYFVDNLQQPLFGFDVKYSAPANPYHPTQVVTTIDKQTQLYVTNTLKDVGISNGGAVILDAKTNDLISLVSLPNFNINSPFGIGAENQIVTSHTPGSIFKIVVAAAAIDHNLTHKFDLFDCDKNLYGDDEEPRQLGMLTFEESFSQSCNYTFSYLANELLKIDQQILHKYAQKLGLTDQVGWIGDVYRLEEITHFPEEERGKVTVEEKDIGDYYAIAQTSIGQKNVRVTPLAVANMLATIARGGEKHQVRGSSKIKYENGTTVVEFPKQLVNNEERISTYTAMRLQQLLRSVVKMEEGTANPLLHSAPYSIAGKTGTAEKGINKNEMTHWFAGYFPAEDPKYVMVILDLDHKGEVKTLKAYRKIVEFLYKNYDGNE